MALYEEIRDQNPEADISFTGHSLGGGLASLMAVYFNRPIGAPGTSNFAEH
jgi:putative lipase involved disintegration of autophagic bodies